MNRNFFLVGLLFAILPTSTFAQKQRSQAFKEKYILKEAVILSRHNIRAPLSTKGSLLEKVTTHPWFEWTAGASELTTRGGALENQFGLYFRKWLVDAGLFKENANPTTNEVNVYANSMQRCIATANYFKTALFPVGDVKVNHRFVPSKMDPVFFPRLTKTSKSFKAQALKEIAAMGGKKGIVGINEDLKECYEITAKVLDLKNSPACKQDNLCAFDNYNTQIILEKGDEPRMKGSLKDANTCSDALILQYYEEPDSKKAAFGHNITLTDWTKIAKIKDVYGDVLFAAPTVAINVAHPLLVYMYDELSDKDRKLSFLCGHDSNIASVTAALEVEPYDLPNSIEKKTPIGCKLVFEKFEGKDGQMYCDINLTYQSTEQLRNIAMLGLNNPPQIFPIALKGLQKNADGLYLLNDVKARFMKAIRAYDKIEDEF
ncbi:histidine-type phosphatase [Hoylesella shahii]|jgi:glucose-1-phosphatase (G1Pase)|uniref:Glucose-1-phosphatase n=1 Tax=Hoylesella shahii DSM 15611 = JCM 12083 TaxID=1122991 RepID=A0A318HWS7_9BACT|nr:histidine-type phosphatase [Hoylesella shahii]PXX21496.1 glucose-1-phosphatase [Hoylesella shahii DSM 15611 = JCM 12083]